MTIQTTYSLSLIDKVNLMKCATDRMADACMDGVRWQSEYLTVLVWKKHDTYNCSNSAGIVHWQG